MKRRKKILISVGVAFAAAATAFWITVVHAILIAEPSTFAPADVALRVDPALDPRGAAHLLDPAERWVTGRLEVISEPQQDGWLLLAAHREDVPPRVERVEIYLALAQPTPRARALVRWYDSGGVPLFTSNEVATNIHGVVTVDANRKPTAVDERTIAYDLDGLRDGKPVHFEGKIIANE